MSNDSLRLPLRARTYLLSQRVSFQRIGGLRVSKKLERRLPLVFRGILTADALIYRRSILRKFRREMAADYAQVAPHLPAECSSILDIGCGIAGIDILLSRHYQGTPTVRLLDRSTVDARIHYGFASKGSFYNDLTVARDVLVRNGVALGSIHLHEANEHNDVPPIGPLDLVISLLSWGHHYPVATYLDRVGDLLAPTGTLILDVRIGTDGLDELGARFRSIVVLSEGTKSLRIAAKGVLPDGDRVHR